MTYSQHKAQDIDQLKRSLFYNETGARVATIVPIVIHNFNT